MSAAKPIHLAVIGGGAAGFFAAMRYAEIHPQAHVHIYEKSGHVLSKVKISGGGRCNVTHACYDQRELVTYYPRGQKELLGPFHRFMTFDTIGWFEARGVPLKTEDDGRMFPVTDNSQTIIDCFMAQTRALGIDVMLNKGLKNFEQVDNGFILHFLDGTHQAAENIILCTGSSSQVWQMLAQKGIETVDPVPSLFTFNYKNKAFNDLMGLAVQHAHVSILNSPFEAAGPLLFTHWGFSGPAVLRLSAWGAPWLAKQNYLFDIAIDFTGKEDEEGVMHDLLALKDQNPGKACKNVPLTYIPKRLWDELCRQAGIGETQFANLSKASLKQLQQLLCRYTVTINGKSTFKDEFVTCGGVDLKEVDMKTLACKKIPGLYFAGECLDVDAITGGFNFQAAWTTGYIAGSSAAGA